MDKITIQELGFKKDESENQIQTIKMFKAVFYFDNGKVIEENVETFSVDSELEFTGEVDGYKEYVLSGKKTYIIKTHG